MKTLTLSALILAAAIPATALQAQAGAVSSTLSATQGSAERADTIRVIRASSASESVDCDKATWPYIPASCLQRESVSKTSNISLNN